MRRLRNTWSLVGTSWRVLKKDRELLWLPVISFLACAGVMLVALAMVAITQSGGNDEFALGGAAILIFVLAVLGIGVAMVFFKGALVAAAYERLSGGDPTVGSGISGAARRLGGLVPWAIIATTVGLVLHALQKRVRGVGGLITRFIGAAWDVVTFLTVPAIVIDRLGAVAALKRSASLLRQTWGETLFARVGFGLIGTVFSLPGILLMPVAANSEGAVAAVAVLLALAWFAVVAVVMSALSAIFQTALYMYATSGVQPEGFEDAHLDEVFAQRG